MNDRCYRWLVGPTRWLCQMAPTAAALGSVARVFGRQLSLLNHLRTLGFDSVVDGGANIGEFAGLVRLALPKAALLCVEPHPECASRLRAAGYRVEEAALWSSTGRATLAEPGGTSTLSTLCQAPSGDDASYAVRTIRLDELDLPGQRILIKLDLQGAELAALEGVGTLWPRVAALHLEMRVAGAEREAVETLIRAQGFFDYATTNEILEDGWVRETDKLWLRKREGANPDSIVLPL